MATYVVIGGGLAGAKAAETLRKEGFDGEIVLVGEESDRPYERPPLSKGYLQGKDEREKAFVHSADWYGENRVDLRLGVAATGLDTAARQVTLGDGSTVTYDKLLLATGATPRRLDLPGGSLDGVHYLRRIGDSEAIKGVLGRRIVVIGGGWIGMEVAAAAREAGSEVTLLEVDTLPLRRVLGDEIAQVFADLHTQKGVDLRTSTKVAAIEGDGTVSGVRLEDGTVIPAEAVVIGVGVAPAVALAEAAGLRVDNGVLTDERLCTSDPDVYAAGDVANAQHPLLGQRIRVEHWANALNQGPAAAKSMLGQDSVYDRMPYFYTDQFDLGMEYTGYVEPGGYDEVVVRGSTEKREFIAFWMRGGRVLAGMNVNVWDVTDPIKALIRSGKAVDTARLADGSVPLDDLAG